MVAGISIYRTIQPTQERELISRMGRADLIAYGTTRADLVPLLPGGSMIEPLVSLDGRIVIAGARPSVSVRAIDIEGLAAGILTLVDGRAPTGPDETRDGRGRRVGGASASGDRSSLRMARPRSWRARREPMYIDDRIVVVDPTGARDRRIVGDMALGLPPAPTRRRSSRQRWTVDRRAGRVIQTRQGSGIQIIGGDSASGHHPDPRHPGDGRIGADRLGCLCGEHPPAPARARPARCHRRNTGALCRDGGRGGRDLGLLACVAGIVVGLGGAIGLSPFLDDLTQRRNPAGGRPRRRRRPDPRRLPRRDDRGDRSRQNGLAGNGAARALRPAPAAVARTAGRCGSGWSRLALPGR